MKIVFQADNGALNFFERTTKCHRTQSSKIMYLKNTNINIHQLLPTLSTTIVTNKVLIVPKVMCTVNVILLVYPLVYALYQSLAIQSR